MLWNFTHNCSESTSSSIHPTIMQIRPLAWYYYIKGKNYISDYYSEIALINARNQNLFILPYCLHSGFENKCKLRLPNIWGDGWGVKRVYYRGKPNAKTQIIKIRRVFNLLPWLLFCSHNFPDSFGWFEHNPTQFVIIIVRQFPNQHFRLNISGNDIHSTILP